MGKEVQRYSCKGCHRSYILRQQGRRRFSHALQEEIVRRHIEGGESYRAIALWLKRLTKKKVSPLHIYKIFESYAARCKTAYEMSVELRPRWNGIVLLDEKRCIVKGTQQWFYLAVDTTGDILHCPPVPELNTTEAIRFLKEVVTLRLKLRGLVTELDSALTGAVNAVCSEIPHQYCIKHALSALAYLIEYTQMKVRRNVIRLQQNDQALVARQMYFITRKRRRLHSSKDQSFKDLKHLDNRAALYQACQSILTARTEEESLSYLNALRTSSVYSAKDQAKVVRFFKRHSTRLMMHHRIAEMPRTTNIIENVNKQLQRRFKSVEAFQYKRTAIDYTNLLIAFLRQKVYTDCRGYRKDLNGKSRLGSAKIRRLNANWLKNCLKPAPKSNRL